MKKKPILFISGNKNKIIEVNRISKNMKCSFEHYNLDLEEIQGTPIDIINRKCEKVMELSNDMCDSYIVEDVSLCFNALNGLPGPYIKWFLENIGCQKIYNLLDTYSDKGAYALCLLAYYDSNTQKTRIFEGKISGYIVNPRGNRNFGWDCIFQPNNCNLTFGEMSQEQKDKYSHRFKAFEKLNNFL
jgi:inosine triphosphate pyrophosphatase